MITLDGRSLTLEQVAAIAAGAQVQADPLALDRVAASARAASQVAAVRAVYGRTTGVGANIDRASAGVGDDGPGRVLLRTHAAAWGPALPSAAVRGALAIRINQLLAGFSGASPMLVRALVGLSREPDSRLPVVHARGSLGMGDLPALAEVGLALVGERPVLDGTRLAPRSIEDADALPLMSSSAFTLAGSAAGCVDLERLSRVSMTVASLSVLALRGNREAFGPAVATVTPFSGAIAVAAQVRLLVGPIEQSPARIQDFFGLRTLPQVHGALVDRLQSLRTTIESLVNTGAENPLVVGVDPPELVHHGGFHTVYLDLALQSAVAALTASAQSVMSRVSHLLTDPRSALPRFLAEPEGSTGLLPVEYAAASALLLLREIAGGPRSSPAPALSVGVEDDATGAAATVARLPECVAAYRHLVSLELLCAARALSFAPVTGAGPLAPALRLCDGLVGDRRDHDLESDIAAATALLDDPALLPEA